MTVGLITLITRKMRLFALTASLASAKVCTRDDQACVFRFEFMFHFLKFFFIFDKHTIVFVRGDMQSNYRRMQLLL